MPERALWLVLLRVGVRLWHFAPAPSGQPRPASTLPGCHCYAASLTAFMSAVEQVHFFTMRYTAVRRGSESDIAYEQRHALAPRACITVTPVQISANNAISPDAALAVARPASSCLKFPPSPPSR
ncbi:hypothetical protein C2E23DRAFT_174715 [Lenzites betulinus]|nr:hypothetical protein C2E23DRAFT_174715 [Lenzites betulinus]